MDDAALKSATDLFELWADGKWDAEAPPLDGAADLVAVVRAAVKRAREEEQKRRLELEQAVNMAAQALGRIVIQGDLTHGGLPTVDFGEIAALYDAVNQSGQLLRDFVTSMKAAATELSAGSHLTHTQLEKNGQVLNEQATTAQELAATLEELKATSVEIERSASTVASLSNESRTASTAGSAAVQDFSVLMSEVEQNAALVSKAVESLSKSVQQIDSVIRLITEVADRSDMLALNASLEAARAGESGRGFAIVADEMRRLSARVMVNTTEVSALITAVRQATAKVSERAGANIEVAANGHQRAIAALENLGGIITAVHETASAAQLISHATGQQRAATTQAAAAVTVLSEEVKQIASGAEKTRASAERLATLSTQIEQLVKRFTTERDA